MPETPTRDPLGPGRQMTPSNEFGRLISQKITSEADTFYHHYDALGSTASLAQPQEQAQAKPTESTAKQNDVDIGVFGKRPNNNACQPNRIEGH